MRVLLATLAVLALGLWLWHGEDAASPAGENLTAQAPRYQLERLDLLRTDEAGRPLVRMVAATGDYYDGGAAELGTVRADGLSGNAAPWQLSSPRGTVAAGEKRLLLHAPVEGQGRWTSGEVFTFKGRDVWVDDAKRQLSSTQPLTLTSPTRTARAQGFVASFDGKTLNMTQPDLSYVLGD